MIFNGRESPLKDVCACFVQAADIMMMAAADKIEIMVFMFSGFIRLIIYSFIQRTELPVQ